MSTPFANTIQSLDLGRGRNLVGVLFTLMVLGPWLAWFFFAKIDPYPSNHLPPTCAPDSVSSGNAEQVTPIQFVLHRLGVEPRPRAAQ